LIFNNRPPTATVANFISKSKPKNVFSSRNKLDIYQVSLTGYTGHCWLVYFFTLLGKYMRPKSATEKTVSELMNVHYGRNLTARERHIYQETLFALVRLAKSEMRLEMKTSVKKLTGPVTFALLRAKRSQRSDQVSGCFQRQFEFHQID
jgi:hypothetical protein